LSSSKFPRFYFSASVFQLFVFAVFSLLFLLFLIPETCLLTYLSELPVPIFARTYIPHKPLRKVFFAGIAKTDRARSSVRRKKTLTGCPIRV